MDEPAFNAVDSSVHVTSYNTGVGSDHVNPGPKIFTLRAIGQSGWRGENTRWFQMNFAPDTWFCGPDPNDPLGGWSSSTDLNGKRYQFRDFSTTGWASFTGVPNTMLTQDSLIQFPAARTERRSFFEAYNDRLWLRQENDTVHMNSWVIIPSGGFDRDSPYTVKVNTFLLPPERRASRSDPGRAERIADRLPHQGQVQDKSGIITEPSETTTYPVFDPASVFHQPVINGYQGLNTAGRGYAVVRAEDGDGTVDRRVDHQPGQAVGIVDRVEHGGASAEDRALRSKVLTFYINHAPQLQTTNPNFYPRTSGTSTIADIITAQTAAPNGLNLPAIDDDWYDPTRFNKVGGTPADYSVILRWKIAILGKDAHEPGYLHHLRSVHRPARRQINVKGKLALGNVILRVRICGAPSATETRGRRRVRSSTTRSVPAGTCVDTDIRAG